MHFSWLLRVSLDAFAYPQEVTRVEETFPQIVKEIKPNEEENVDAHPDHLWNHKSVSTGK